MGRKPPMTETEARENVAAMLAETPRNARNRVWKMALLTGNLSPEAKAVYRNALEADRAEV